MKPISQFNEKLLLEIIASMNRCRDDSVILGIGDDAAAVRFNSEILLISTDMLVEGIHFRREFTTAKQLGSKAITVCLSDIASMGGTPRWVTVSLGIPQHTDLDEVQEFFRGLKSAGDKYGVIVVGGDTVRSPGPWIIDVASLGSAKPGNLKPRSAAKVGEFLLVTGELGASAAGLDVLLHSEADIPTEARQEAVYRHICPPARVSEGIFLGTLEHVSAMIDISDGLGKEVHEIAAASNVGIMLEGDLIPIAPSATVVATCMSKDPADYALWGGEDYELLFTVSPGRHQEIMEMLPKRYGTKVSVIGRVVPPEEGVTIRKEGERLPLPNWGYDHFSKSWRGALYGD